MNYHTTQLMNPTISSILHQLAEEAAFLWHLRGGILQSPHFSLSDLERFDERLEAQVDGLRVGGDASWEICRSALAGDTVEGLFAPATLAFEGGNSEHLQQVMDAMGTDREKARAVISALGWLPYEQARPRIEQLLADESPFHRYIGMAACAIHRHDPGPQLTRAVNDTSPLLMARGLRAYGELGRGCELNDFRLQEYLTDHDDEIRFSAAWSASLAGIGTAVGVLRSFVASSSRYAEKALNVSVRCMRPESARAWQRELAQSSETIRFAAIGAGALGDPALVPWLIDRMDTPTIARVAGEALTMITGIDIELEELAGSRPEGFNAGPTDDPKDLNVAMDADENLPWPDADRVAAWWDKNKGRFQSGTRYFLGKPVSPEHLRLALKTGLQRQRAAAALELARMNPGRPMFEVRAPAARQRKEVAAI
ncbi:MAG TPA: TIGR02270 family protein [Geobacter sulfurreducens]|nr:TIGR02270 family protein [Geobacter sulfurreducens]